MSLDWNSLFAGRMAGVTASEIRELLKLIDRPEIISFAGGIPDPDLFPREAIARAHERILRGNSSAAAALQYSISEGFPPLREWIAARFPVTPDEILVTNGSQQGLEFVGRLLIGPGEKVAVTAPTYLGALQAFSFAQPSYLSVAMDEEGILLEPLEEALKQRPKLLYLVPDFQNPTGITMSLERRKAVVALCRRYGVPIVEDTAYTALRYEGEALPSLFELDDRSDGGIVIYAGTFSKTLVPALRVGWLMGARPVIDKLVLVKQGSDLHTGTLNQMVVHAVAEEVFDAQVARACDAYRKRRDAMLAALEEFMPPGVRWTRPQGGMFVWIELPEGFDGAELLKRSIGEANVAFVPGASFFPDRSGRNTIRVSFSMSKPETIREGVRRLAGMLQPATAAR